MTALDTLRRRVMNLLGRAVISWVTDTDTRQTVQLTIRSGDVAEVRDKAERFQDYGFTSHPKRGAEAIVLFPGGHRAHAIIIAVDDRRYRKTGLEEGEVALYSDETDCVVLKRGRIIEITAGTKVHVTAPLVDESGDHNVAGVYKVAGTQVVGPQLGSITPPIGGATIDSAARTAINSIISRLQTHGLTA
jgi:phage baseplate assembly protein V